MADSIPRSDPLPSAINEHTKCEECGATVRLGTGVCVSCLLRKGLEGGEEVSQVFYQGVLAEVDAPRKSWFLGNYEILEQIGCGGMGVIYRARQRHSRRIVAIKRVLSYRADSNGALQRFRREAQAVASLDHPNILPIYEVSESDDGLPFFSMKFATKGSLSENLASLRDEPRNCVQLMAKVARAVEYAHSRGVLHRDLKPGNILLDDRGEPLVSDFGLAKLLDGNNDLTRSLTTFGTAGFIAPEQAGHAAVDFTPVADVYSLGAVLFNVLAGRPPFLGSNPVAVIRQASEMQAPKLRPLSRDSGVDRDLETICERCLERDPKARYQSAGELAADLERWLDGRPIIARPVLPPARIWRWSRRNPKLVGATIAGLVLGAAGVWLFRAELFRASEFNPPQRSIAVLPFTDASETRDQENLSDSISEEILDTLGTVQGLSVVGRTSSFAFKGKSTNATQIGQKLNVGNVLEGTLRRQGNRVRVTAELIDARNGFRVWTETYDRELNGASALQGEIATSIVDALKNKLVVGPSGHEQPGNGLNDLYPPGFFTDVTRSTATSRMDSGVPEQKTSSPFPVADSRSPEELEARPPDTRVTAAPPVAPSAASLPHRVSEASPAMNKITAESPPASSGPESMTSARDRASQAGQPTNKVTADVRPFDREAVIGSASIQGFVKNAKGEPIKGADLRIESRDGKQVVTTVKTDPQGRYVSQRLEPGVYRVSLVVNGALKASIMNTQTKANRPTQLNFDLMPASQTAKSAKGGKHMVWVPGRTGSHLGGNWVEVDETGKEHSSSNVQTVTTSSW
jgi:serine/threonine protein kinase